MASSIIIGKCIKFERKLHKFSQKELAELVHVELDYLRKLEKGDFSTNELPLYLLYAIAEALRINTDYLLEPRKTKPYQIHWCTNKDLVCNL